MVDGLRAAATGAGVSLTAPQPPADLDADLDPIRVREIVANLVTNGLKATPSGGEVAITVEQLGDRVTITVTDTGRGIPPSDLNRVFERFHKGPDSGGSGLGLTISRNLAVAHGGTLTLTSEEGVGTTARVELPLG